MAGVSGLHMAVFRERPDVLKSMLEEGEQDVNQTDKYGQGPIFLACYKRSAEMVKLLVDAGADITVADCNGHTLLHACSMVGAVDALKVLIEHARKEGVKLDAGARNKEGKTALDEAKEHCPGALCADIVTLVEQILREQQPDASPPPPPLTPPPSLSSPSSPSSTSATNGGGRSIGRDPPVFAAAPPRQVGAAPSPELFTALSAHLEALNVGLGDVRQQISRATTAAAPAATSSSSPLPPQVLSVPAALSGTLPVALATAYSTTAVPHRAASDASSSDALTSLLRHKLAMTDQQQELMRRLEESVSRLEGRLASMESRLMSLEAKTTPSSSSAAAANQPK